MKKSIILLGKYIFSIILICLAYTIDHNLLKLFLCLLELIAIISLSNYLNCKNKYLGYFSSFLLFLFNAEMLFSFFGGSFITWVMLENTDSIRDLGGKIIPYSIGVILTVAFSFLPCPKFKQFKKISLYGFICIAIFEVFYICNNDTPLFPSMAMVNVYSQYKDHAKLDSLINSKNASLTTENSSISQNSSIIVTSDTANTPNEASNSSLSDNDTLNSLSKSISDNCIISYYVSSSYDASSIKYEEGAVAQTDYIDHSYNKLGSNIILIFTEGLSQSIIDDERNIMPNVAYYQSKSMNFTNYFNHTFATYRGIIGQLYSGHQFDNLDTNNLVSIMDVLEANNYKTVMINTEPHNEEFSQYLNSLGFDEVIDFGSDNNNIVDALLDKSAYEKLYETANRLESDSQPYFLVIYTFGTHATLDSPNQKYGDGSNALLNKFYNDDYQFGRFMEKFTHSSLPEDTMLVFTADHSTFADEDFFNTFPNYNRTCNDCDSIPFFIYYSGWNIEIDASGRNSLDMAPTLLDLLNLKEPESFLGTSLFESKMSGISLDTYFWDTAYTCYTGDGIPKIIYDDTTENLFNRISEYFAVK